MFDSVATYHVHRRNPLPLNNAVAYQYVIAAAGVYLRAENRFFDVLAPIVRCQIRGLAPLQPHFRLKVPRLPGRLLDVVLSDARRARFRNGSLKEVLYHFHHGGLAQGARVRVLKPPQRATAASVVGAEGDAAGVILDLHSHGDMSAFWSGTDNHDEQGFRAYGVTGRLDTAPEIRLRLGVYGYWFPLPVSLLFDGSGGFVDILSFITAPHGGRILDPCAGEGTALVTLAGALQLEPFGVELHEGRAREALTRVNALVPDQDSMSEARRRILNHSYQSLLTSRDGFNLLYLNPPYDHDDEDGRLEYQFLWRCRPWLQPGGLLVWVVPQHLLKFPSGGSLARRARRNAGRALARFPCCCIFPNNCSIISL